MFKQFLTSKQVTCEFILTQTESMSDSQWDRVRIFIENPLQNTTALHVKMKVPPKVFCMRVTRSNSLDHLHRLVAQRIHLDSRKWRIVNLSLSMNHAEIDSPLLLETNDTLRVHLE